MPGKNAAHVEFTNDGRYALLSVWDTDGALIVYDAKTLEEVRTHPDEQAIGQVQRRQQDRVRRRHLALASLRVARREQRATYHPQANTIRGSSTFIALKADHGHRSRPHLLEIIRSGSFIATAERLHITQTAVTARVHNLEEQRWVAGCSYAIGPGRG